MPKKDKELVIEGLALRAVVRAAESRVTGRVVKHQLFSDLDLDDLMELDLRGEDPSPAVRPLHVDLRDEEG